MVHLLNEGMTIFGRPVGNSNATIAWLVAIQVIIGVAVISAILYLILGKKLAKRSKQKVVHTTEVVCAEGAQSPVERVLTGISLDLTLVKKDFVVGEQFNSDGLVVRGDFNISPTVETYVDFDVIDYDTYTRLERRGDALGLYVIKPSMYMSGVKVVTVKYKNFSVDYPISIADSYQASATPAEKPSATDEEIFPTLTQTDVDSTSNVLDAVAASNAVETEVSSEQQTRFVAQRDLQIVEEDSYEATLRYDRSFMARFIQSEDDVKRWYTDIKNDLLSYNGVKARISWKRETFKCGGKLVLAKLAYRGKILCIFFPLKVNDYIKDYPVEDASDASCYEDTPLMIRLKNTKRIEIARKLIRVVMEQNGMKMGSRESVDYYLPYEGILNLINKGLVKRNIRTPEHESIFSQASTTEDEDDPLTLTKVGPGIYVTKKD